MKLFQSIFLITLLSAYTYSKPVNEEDRIDLNLSLAPPGSESTSLQPIANSEPSLMPPINVSPPDKSKGKKRKHDFTLKIEVSKRKLLIQSVKEAYLFCLS